VLQGEELGVLALTFDAGIRRRGREGQRTPSNLARAVDVAFAVLSDDEAEEFGVGRRVGLPLSVA
jgi:hypothetical protein